MQTVAQGGSITLHVTYQFSTGELIDPDVQTVEIVAPDGSVVVDGAVPTRDDLGRYSFTFAAGPEAAVGTWTARWSGTYGGNTMITTDEFSVVPVGMGTTTADIVTRLRRLIGERIGIGKTQIDTRFLDQEISDTFYANNEDWDKTLAELWMAKAAYLGDFVDVNESGTSRALSQMAKAAMAQATKYEAKVQAYENAWQATYRVPGRTFSPYGRGTGSRLVGPVVIFVEDTQRAWTV